MAEPLRVQQATGKVKVSLGQMVGLLWPYVKKRVVEQIKSVALIILYLIFFQTVVLGLPVVDASIIAGGLVLVICGLTFFLEGLLLGLMPLGEVCGVQLPQKSKLPVILIFAFILGVGATFAEPAIGVLKAGGSSVMAWDAPLLFLLLNRYSDLLVNAVGIGVGVAVVFGMLRFLYDWSLKPFICVLVGGTVVFSVWAFFDANMRFLTGLAWDCGAVTTGPVTVPLVLALGIGICRVVGSAGSGSAGFGVVTLASLFPILSVLCLGSFLAGSVPQPMPPEELFHAQNRKNAEILFEDKEAMTHYVLMNANEAGQNALFDGQDKMLAFVQEMLTDVSVRQSIFTEDSDGLQRWAATRGTDEQKQIVFGSVEAIREGQIQYAKPANADFALGDLLNRNIRAAIQAIIPLTIFLMFFLVAILREKLPHADEVFLGLFFALIGMGIFNIGIEIGLAKLGTQVGGKLPSAFKPIELVDEIHTIRGFDTELVQTSIKPSGEKEQFFYAKIDNQYVALPFDVKRFDAPAKQYTYTPTRGPLFGGEGGITGILVILIFAFIMGYGATLAEPALNALGVTVEELTVGTFKKSLLMQCVALGVGAGITLGVAKIIWNIPLIYLLGLPYVVLLILTVMSTEEFVNIGWDSAGVTTGPITVPLVLAMGLGIGSQVGVVEGFGILSMASVCPILAVLTTGLVITKRRNTTLQSSQEAA